MKYLSQIEKQFNRLFTSTELGTVYARTGSYSVSLTVTVGTHSFTIAGITSETLHKAAGDRWYFYGVYENLRNLYLDNNLTLSSVSFVYTITDDAAPTTYNATVTDTENILFCLSNVSGLTAQQFVDANCLMSSSVGYICDGVSIPLKLYALFVPVTGNNPIIQRIPYRERYYYYDSNGVVQVNQLTSFFNTQGLLSDTLTKPNNIANDRFIKAIFDCGSRYFTVYNLLNPRTETFRFRNRWNTEEICVIPCSIQSEPKTEYELATCNEVDVAYDVEHRTEHTLKSAPIHSQMYQTLLQLCRSHKVEYLTPSGYQRINIKEYDLPKSTEPSSTITLEMTFELAALTETIQL